MYLILLKHHVYRIGLSLWIGFNIWEKKCPRTSIFRKLVFLKWMMWD